MNLQNRCERCGYIAMNKNTLIKHVKDEKQCHALLSSISHVDLLNKINPPPDLTCSFCHLLCKSKSAQTLHTKYYCHLNPNRIEKRKTKNKDDNIQCNDTSISETTRRYIHKNTSQTKGLHPFNKDIDWSSIDITKSSMLNYMVSMAQGIIDLFVNIHSLDNHKNIEWVNDKLVVYDGKGWTELDTELLSTHVGFLYSHMEEWWCDYQMDIRCGNINNNIDDETTQLVDDFLYNQIVDDGSVLFHCGDGISDYLETLKTCS